MAPPKVQLVDKAASALDAAENLLEIGQSAHDRVRMELFRSIAYSLLAIAKFEIPMDGKG